MFVFGRSSGAECPSGGRRQRLPRRRLPRYRRQYQRIIPRRRPPRPPTPSACRQRHHHPYQRRSSLCRKRRRLCFKLVSIWKAKLVVTCADRVGVLVFTSSSSFYSPPLPFRPRPRPSLVCPFSFFPPFPYLFLLSLLYER